MSAKSKKKRRKDRRSERSGLSGRVQERIIVALIIALPFILYFRYVFGGSMLYGSDWLISGYTAREFIAGYIGSHGRLPLWHPYVFGGLPTVAAFLGDIFYPTTLFRIFMPVHRVWSCTFAAHIALAGVATYYFSRDLRLNRYAAAVGAVAYMFCGSLVSMTSPGHDAKMICASLLPVALLLFNKAIDTGKLYRFILAGAVVGFSFLAGHVQMTYYMTLVLFAFLLFRLYGMWRSGRKRGTIGKTALFSVLAVLFMVCFVSVQYLPVYDYLGFAARGEERGYVWSTSWSLPTSELVDLITPHFSGLGSRYWGTNYFKLDSQYLGILPLLLAPLALLGDRPRSVKFFAGLALFGTVMALGGHTPLYRLAYHLIPGLKKFRGPSMIFFTASFAVAMLSAFGAARVMQDLNGARRRKIGAYLFVVVALVLLFALVSAGARDSMIGFISQRVKPYISSNYSPAVAAQKIENLRSNYPSFLKGLYWAVFLVAANAGLIYMLASRKINRAAWCGFVCLLLVVDTWIVWLGGEHPFIRPAPEPATYFAEDEAISFLKRQDGIFRVYPFRYDHTNDNLLMHYDIQSIAGYHGNQLQSYQDFIGAGRSVMFNAGNLGYQNFLDLLNARYIVSFVLPEDVSGFKQRTRDAIERIKEFLDRESFKRVFSGRRYVIYENASVLERAILVPGYEIVRRDMILDRLKQESFNPGSVVLLEEDPGIGVAGGKGPVGRVEFLEYGPNRIIVKTEAEENTILLLSENHYDEWQATVDGKESEIYRADYTFRAIPLSAGMHTVEMVYDSFALKFGAVLSMVSLVLLAGCVFLWRMDMVRSRSRGGL